MILTQLNRDNSVPASQGLTACLYQLFSLAGVVATIAKLTKSCILRLSTDKLYFILSERAANGGVSVWCELAQVGRIKAGTGTLIQHKNVVLPV